jgi:hypothetical protein
MIVLEGEISRQIVGLSRHLEKHTAPTGLRAALRELSCADIR